MWDVFSLKRPSHCCNLCADAYRFGMCWWFGNRVHDNAHGAEKYQRWNLDASWILLELGLPVLIIDDSLVIVSRSYHKGQKIKGTYDDVERVLSGFKNEPGYLPQVVRTKHWRFEGLEIAKKATRAERIEVCSAYLAHPGRRRSLKILRTSIWTILCSILSIPVIRRGNSVRSWSECSVKRSQRS